MLPRKDSQLQAHFALRQLRSAIAQRFFGWSGAWEAKPGLKEACLQSEARGLVRTMRLGVSISTAPYSLGSHPVLCSICQFPPDVGAHVGRN